MGNEIRPVKDLSMNIPGYQIIRELGHGGMATVYLAVQESLGRQVALKVMSPALAADRNFGERFLREGRTVAQLTHSNILAVYDTGSVSHSYYLAMEYVSGGDLKERIRQGAVPPREALAILRQVAAALGYAHGQGFVHRDVKPDNVLFRDNGSVVLTDFGIAKAVGSGTQMTGTGMTIGTAHYMSPEQAQGRSELDGRSDLYSLGIVFYEMLVGRVPYEADNTIGIAMQHVQGVLPELPDYLFTYQPLLDRLLAKNPSDRYVDAEELISAISQLESGRPLMRTAEKTQVISRIPDPVKEQGRAVDATANKHIGIIWALGGALLAMMVFGGLWITQHKSKPEFVASGPVSIPSSSRPAVEPLAERAPIVSVEDDNSVSNQLQAAEEPPFNDSVNDSSRHGVESVKTVLDEWLHSYSTGDIDTLCSLYATEVDFYESGVVDRSFIQNEGQKYFARWPSRHGKFRGDPSIRILEPGTSAEVSFIWWFSVERSGSNIQGLARSSMLLKRFDEQWLIVRIREKVLERQKSG